MSADKKNPKTGGGIERRRFPRAQIDGIVTLQLKSGVHNAKLRDISSSGVSFYIDRSVPLMTLLELRLELPAASPRPITARGAVVRCDRIGASVEHWEVAVFLHETTERDRAAIEAFVAARASTKIAHSAASAGE
jgi:hypothetical protein